MRAIRAVVWVAVLVSGVNSVFAEDFASWRYFRRVQFDTTAGGANVQGDVANFPVALELSQANFDFAQAREDGGDIRFSAERNGVPLAHHIEHWVGSNHTALVWVKVPEVRGNAAGQAIYMHWGNPSAADASRSQSVFDTREGFVGVWHLADEASMVPGGYLDATANAANGTGVNLVRSSRVDARLGRGVALRHAVAQWIYVGDEKRKLFDVTTNVTFSIWAKAHGYRNAGDESRRALPGYETMFAKGDNSWRLQKFGIRGWHNPPAELIEICVERPPRGDLCVVGRTDMVTNQWFHFTGVHDHPRVRLYVNGVLDKEEIFDVPWWSGDHAVGIGNQSQFPDQGRSWDGELDEARVLSVVKDEHWIKLDFESQREGQRFLKLGQTETRF